MSTTDLPYDPSQIERLAEEATEAGFSNRNFGKLTVTPMVLTWATENGVRKPTRRALLPGEALQRGETMEIRFIVDIKEFNPALNFAYERTVTVRKTRRVGERMIEPTDWTEIVEPSLLKVFGKHWPMELLKQPYVEVEDFPNISGKASKTSGKMWGVPKFLRRFKSAQDALAARNELYPAGEAASGNGIPAETLDDIRQLVKANGREAVLELLEGKPYGDIEPEVLLQMAGV